MLLWKKKRDLDHSVFLFCAASRSKLKTLQILTRDGNRLDLYMPSCIAKDFLAVMPHCSQRIIRISNTPFEWVILKAISTMSTARTSLAVRDQLFLTKQLYDDIKSILLLMTESKCKCIPHASDYNGCITWDMDRHKLIWGLQADANILFVHSCQC